MLNSILKKLNGHATDVDGLIAAVADLGQARDAARSELSELQVRRHQALLDDASDQTLDKLEREIERKETTLEKLELAEPGLRDRLAAARAEARQRRWSALRAAYVIGVGEFLVAARSAIEKHIALAAIVEGAQREGFEREVAAHMPPQPNVNGHPLLAAELIDVWEMAVTPPAVPARRPAKVTADDSIPSWQDPTDPAYHQPTAKNLRDVMQRPRGSSSQHAIALDGGVPTAIEALTAGRLSDDIAPLEPGQVRARVLRSGYSPADDRPQCCRGQVIRLPRRTAEKAAAAGVLEILKERPSKEQSEERPAGSMQHVVPTVGPDAASQESK